MKTLLICALVIVLVFAGTASIGQEDDENTLPFWDQISAWYLALYGEIPQPCEFLPPVVVFWSDEKLEEEMMAWGCISEEEADQETSEIIDQEPEWVTDPLNNTYDPVYEDIFGSGSNPFAGYGG